MLQNLKELYGHRLSALDGGIGQVKDFYFDDRIWVVRYLVADTGSWLDGRLVLLSPHAFGKWDQFENSLQVKVTKQQIQNSPSIDKHQPVSRQFESDYYRYYGWPVYWNGGGIWGLGGYPEVPPASEKEMDTNRRHRLEKHLQSALAVTGFQIQATDEVIGQVSSFLVDDRSWVIRDLVIEASQWFSDKDVLIPPSLIERISYVESKVYLNVSKADIQRAAKGVLVKSGAR